MPRRLLYSLLLVAALAAPATAAERAAVSSAARTKIPDAQRSTVAEALADTGLVRVIVELQSPARAQAWAGTAAETKRQLASNRALQRSVVQSHFGMAATVETGRSARSRGLTFMPLSPMFAADVSTRELDALARDTRVARLQLDKLDRPLLNNSVGDIHMTGESGAWAVGATGDNQERWRYGIAVLDTGVRRKHPFLRNRMTEQDMCFSTQSKASKATSLCGNGSPSGFGEGAAQDCNLSIDGCGHGTHVAGIAAGVNPKPTLASPRRGVAPGALIQAVTVFSRIDDAEKCKPLKSPCVQSFTSDQVRALDKIFADRNIIDLVQPINIEAINMSLGGNPTSGFCSDDPRAEVIKNLRNVAQIATVVAAGNNGMTNQVSAPACIPAVIAVGNADTSGTNFRIAPGTNNGQAVDLFAPGTNILSSYYDLAGTARYSRLSGTSMAAPHVAGAIVAIRSRLRKSLVPPSGRTVDAIEAALKATGTTIVDNRTGGTFNKPFINVDRALDQLMAEKTLVLNNPDLSFSGPAGGPLAPATRALSVSTLSPGPSRYSVTAKPTWLNVNPPSFLGTFPAGFAVQLSPTQAVEGLPPGTYQGTVELTQGKLNQRLRRTVRLTVTTPPPPANDNLAGAIAIAMPNAGVPVTVEGRNAGATIEAGEPAHRNGALGSVWYTITPAFTGRLDLRVEPVAGAFQIKPKVAVYTGNAVGALTEVAVDLTNVDLRSEVVLHVVAGTPYRVMVGGKPEGSSFSFGRFSLTATQNVSSVVVDPAGTLAFVRRIGESPAPASLPLTLASPTGNATFTITAPSWMNVSAASGSISFLQPTVVTLSPNPAEQSDLVATRSGTITVSASTGQTIQRTVTLEVRPASGAPANDNFRDAITVDGVVPGNTVLVQGSNTNASRQSWEPRNPATQGDRSVWWTFQGSSGSTVIVETTGSGYDTTLAVYRWAGLELGLRLVASNDDNAGTLQSLVQFEPQAGSYYYVVVDGYRGGFGTAQGPIQLRLTQLPLVR